MTFSTLWGLLSPRLNYTGMKWASYSLSCCLYSHLLQLPSYYRCDHTQPLSLFICRQLVQHILSTSVVPLNPSMLSCSFLHQHMTPIVDTNVASFLNLIIPSTNTTHGHFSLIGKLAWLCIRWHAFLHDWKEKVCIFMTRWPLWHHWLNVHEFCPDLRNLREVGEMEKTFLSWDAKESNLWPACCSLVHKEQGFVKQSSCGRQFTVYRASSPTERMPRTAIWSRSPPTPVPQFTSTCWTTSL